MTCSCDFLEKKEPSDLKESLATENWQKSKLTSTIWHANRERFILKSFWFELFIVITKQ